MSNTAAPSPHQRIATVLLRIAGLSCTQRFAWLALNGLPQAQQLYDDPLDRNPGAIDILLEPGQSAAAAAMLRSAGFAALPQTAADVGTLASAALRADPRMILIEPETQARVHLHERLFFAGPRIGLLRQTHVPRISADDKDIPCAPIGAAMALDILLRGNARCWTAEKWLHDLRSVLARLDEAELCILRDAIEAAGFAPAAAASLTLCQRSLKASLPPTIAAWLARRADLPEVEARLELYRSTPVPDMPQLPAAASRNPWSRLHRRIFPAMGAYTRDPATRIDRYPLAFHFARRQLGSAPRILSFGCSTGEEVATLRAYFPEASIKGIDIDAHAIAAARHRLASDADVEFARASTAAKEPGGVYDAIFCMAVFRNPQLDRPETRRATGPLTFARFESEIAELVRCLRPGGLLFVEHGNFQVMDSSAAALLQPVLHSDPSGSGLEPGLYDRNDRRIDNGADPCLGFARLGA